MAFQGDSIFWVEVEKIVPNPFQPRREFDEAKLRELAESIRMYGVLQPLTVTRKEVFEEDGSFRTEYELIAGERRLRASRLAGLEQVPVLIRSGEQTEQEKLELAIIENLQREDLNAVDRALAFRQLAEMFTLSHADVAKKVGRSREYVSNSIRLLALPDYMLEALKRSEISEGHARTLLMLKDRPEEQGVVFREIILKKLSVREVERIARKIATDKVRKKEWLNTDAHLIEMERAFTDTLGTRVQISKTDFGGKLTIDYFSETDLEKLLSVIKTRENLWEVPAVPVSGEEVLEGVTTIRTMDEMVTPLQDIVDATPLEVVLDAEPASLVGETVDVPVAVEQVHHTPLPEQPQSPVYAEQLAKLQAVAYVSAVHEEAVTLPSAPAFAPVALTTETEVVVAPVVPVGLPLASADALETVSVPVVTPQAVPTMNFSAIYSAVSAAVPTYVASATPLPVAAPQLVVAQPIVSPVMEPISFHEAAAMLPSVQQAQSALPLVVPAAVPFTVTAAATPLSQVPAVEALASAAEDDLYAMKNFSL